MSTKFEKAANIASKFINSTNCPVFLTGRAGTGKTTFLKEMVRTSHKNTIVAAPTGIAAINAEGVTLHSLFQLPFGCFIPSDNTAGNDNISVQLNTPRTLLRDLQMNATKRRMLQELELLIIDEVSMLRADLLDAIDTVLRAIRRKKNTPFGGVQMLFIGDLLQLPPVVKNEEKKYLAPYYPSIYFFMAKALEHRKPKYIELEKIYRQTDQQFISILNRLRNNQVSDDDISILNKYYKPSFKTEEGDGYISLTTHNWKADEINREALRKLPGSMYSYDATVKGDFNEKSYPVEYTLKLKKGAQVMFIKNDYSGEHRYFNGKIGKVSYLDDEEITVSFDDGSMPATVEPYTWENKRYTLDKGTNEIKEKVIGTFTHHPVKLAWAITVHKSQGLTFRKAIIDVSGAFAPGQVYVALSRLESLDGLVLTAPVPTSGLEQEASIKEFSENKERHELLEEAYKAESLRFTTEFVLNAFNFRWLDNSLRYHIESYDKDLVRSVKQQHKPWAVKLRADFAPVKDVAGKFLLQAEKILNSEKENYLDTLHQRVIAAKGYFEPILKDFSKRIFAHINDLEGEKRVKTYQNELRSLELLFFKQLQLIYKSEALIKSSIDNSELTREKLQNTTLYSDRQDTFSESGKQKKPKQKKEKGITKAISLKLFKEGKSIPEIAKERSLATTTIEGHLAHYVALGELEAKQFIDEAKMEAIISKAKELDTKNLTPIKNALDFEATYSELRFAIAEYNYKQSQKGKDA